MGEIVSFSQAAKKAREKTRAKGSTLCKNGFHKWKAVKETRFDVKQGKLVTLSRCERCGKEKIQKT